MVCFGRVGRKVKRGEDRAEKQPRAVLPRYEIRVLALPAKPGGGRERLFHHGGGVDEDFHIAAGLRDQPARERLEPRLDDVVVVIALGIHRDRAAAALSQDRKRVAVGAVVHP